MRESRTYGSVRGAYDETHVPTATAARCLFLAQSGPSGMSASRSLLGEKRTTFAHFETFRF